jgi:hypothetical protein
MNPDMRERTGMTTIDICPACGYPKFGPGLCAYCVAMQAMSDDHTFVDAWSGTATFQSGARFGPAKSSSPSARQP